MPRKKKQEKTEKTEEKKEQGKKEEKEQKLLVPLEDYIGCSAHIGTRVITPSMRKYVYRRKADGLAVINTTMIDEKIKVAADFISQYNAEDTILVCKREVGWKASEKFSELTGIRTFTRKYPAGIITNPDLENFFEPKLLIIVDPWVDKNALRDAVKINIPIVALCDTNNNTNYIDIVMPCNNKTNKSVSLVLYILAKLYLKNKGIKAKVNKDDFYKLEKKEEKIREKKERKVEVKAVAEGAKDGV
jgi:small subunit ribosomal protein S2